MTEINPQNGMPIQSSVTRNETKQKENTVQQPIEQPVKEMTQKDLGNVPAAAIGQSQVQVIPPDSLGEDLKTFAANPELVRKSLAVGEKAEENFKKRGVEEANLKALNVEKAFTDEFAD